jgi:hypothetical protein
MVREPDPLLGTQPFAFASRRAGRPCEVGIEMAIRAKNELTSGGYVNNYDAIVTVNLYSRQISFGLEYE